MTKLVYSTLIGIMLGSMVLSRPMLAQDLKVVDSLKLEGLELQAHQDKKAVVLVFTSSHCSWALQYVDRLIELHKKYDSTQVQFVAINSNDTTLSQRDGVSRMRKIANYPFPYLKDNDQSVAKQLQIVKTPEVLVLVPGEKGFDIFYRGKIDDNPVDAKAVKNPFLQNAIDAALEGKELEKNRTMPNGCSIKWMD